MARGAAGVERQGGLLECKRPDLLDAGRETTGLVDGLSIGCVAAHTDGRRRRTQHARTCMGMPSCLHRISEFGDDPTGVRSLGSLPL